MKTTYPFWKMNSNLGGNLFISKDNYLVPMIYLRYLVFHPLAPSYFSTNYAHFLNIIRNTYSLFFETH